MLARVSSFTGMAAHGSPATIAGAPAEPTGELSVALKPFRREHEQHVERSNDVRADRIAREERPPRCPIGSRKHVHFDRMERFTA